MSAQRVGPRQTRVIRGSAEGKAGYWQRTAWDATDRLSGETGACWPGLRVSFCLRLGSNLGLGTYLGFQTGKTYSTGSTSTVATGVR